jgi:hypothetical protein
MKIEIVNAVVIESYTDEIAESCALLEYMRMALIPQENYTFFLILDGRWMAEPGPDWFSMK